MAEPFRSLPPRSPKNCTLSVCYHVIDWEAMWGCSSVIKEEVSMLHIILAKRMLVTYVPGIIKASDILNFRIHLSYLRSLCHHINQKGQRNKKTIPSNCKRNSISDLRACCNDVLSSSAVFNCTVIYKTYTINCQCSFKCFSFWLTYQREKNNSHDTKNIQRLCSHLTALWHFINFALLSHTCKVVRECFKGDEASQWKRPKFDPSPR